jgi:hypothetical protein
MTILQKQSKVKITYERAFKEKIYEFKKTI